MIFTDEGVISAWRLFNAALALVAFVLVLWRGVKPRIRQASRETQLMMLTTLVLLLTSMVGSVEAAINSIPMGIRVPMLTAALIWAILAMTVFRDPD